MTTALTFDPVGHRYDLDGARVPSVTGILKAAGRITFEGVPPGILAAARLRGDRVHRAIHFYNENDLNVDQFIDALPQYGGYLLAWIDFCRQRRFEPVFNECRVASRRHRLAGTLDCLGLLDGRAVVVDFKTGRPDDVSTHLQTAAYLGFAREWAADNPALGLFFQAHPVVTRLAVQLFADGRSLVETYRAPSDYREFLALAAEHREAA